MKEDLVAPDAAPGREALKLLAAAFLYLLLAQVLAAVFRGHSPLEMTASLFITFGIVKANLLPGAVMVFLCLLAVHFRLIPRERLMPAGIVFLATLVFFAGFQPVKTTLPSIIPFWADPPLAVLDRWLHLGADPWVWTHDVMARRSAGWLTPDLFAQVYVKLWLIVALSFPALLYLTDADRKRRHHFIGLYALSWVILGNVIALVFMSGGPIYYERLTGADDFADLMVALDSSGVSGSLTGSLHEYLWMTYDRGLLGVGSGISAFPSVHVAIATLVALYTWERQRALGLLATAYLAIILFLSVYLAWHYAVDGYASILTILGVHLAFRRRYGAGAPCLAEPNRQP
ncbi:phosphatase PAP2 family protein [Tropicimonas sp. TH_r6]|uniref:phosphatase PAP2 family protein n=1 Tax=Tropicimonas sp. TH_r6 TaxID=3082085 RepID=UPI002954E8B0|nr:phosphatase PAP2 family protein [Tropicimonas sp. TH_r6]MDV7142884.1 phosphatase PAP2 family protein [Tropicimonas sp. TH_r6]